MLNPSEPGHWHGYLVVEVDVNVFTEGVSFREAGGAVLHQVEGLQRTE